MNKKYINNRNCNLYGTLLLTQKKKRNNEQKDQWLEKCSGQSYEIQALTLNDGSCPFESWFRKLRDVTAKQRIQSRIDRLERGNFGDAKSIGNGIHELRIDTGPGYRVYFANFGTTLIIIICGGDKSSQTSDIKKAKDLWLSYEAEQSKGS